MTRPVLTTKERAFIAYLFSDAQFSAPRAAELAHYRHPQVVGRTIAERPQVAREITKRLDDLSLGRGETLLRLSQIARGAMSFFVRNGQVDLSSKQAKENYHLIKTIRENTNIEYDSEGNVKRESRNVTIEVYDALAALTVLAKYHGLLQVEALSNTTTTNNTLIMQNATLDQQLKHIAQSDDPAVLERVQAQVMQEAANILAEMSGRTGVTIDVDTQALNSQSLTNPLDTTIE